jgi:hypothetical protein
MTKQHPALKVGLGGNLLLNIVSSESADYCSLKIIDRARIISWRFLYTQNICVSINIEIYVIQNIWFSGQISVRIRAWIIKMKTSFALVYTQVKSGPLKCLPNSALRYTFNHSKLSTQKPPTSIAGTIVRLIILWGDIILGHISPKNHNKSNFTQIMWHVFEN